MIWMLWACGTPAQEEVLSEQKDIAPQIRLLSRREYRNTVMDVLGLEVPSQETCSTDSDCDLESESCSFGQCIVDDCSKKTFIYEGHPSDEVFVLGSFSNWSTDLNWGAWKMEWSASHEAHYIKGDILPIHITEKYRYQFVVNGEKIADPRNDEVEIHNNLPYSVLRLNCSHNGRYEMDPTDGFPAESRGAGFHFDHQSSRGIVTTQHLDRYIRSADWIVQSLRFDQVLPCIQDETSEYLCSEQFFEKLGTKLFRRVMSTEEKELYLGTYEELRANLSQEETYQELLFMMLSSPYFLYRTEVGQIEGDKRVLTHSEIASAMSYFLWGSAPDQELIQASEEGLLHSAQERKSQAQRMLSDQRAQRHAKDFFAYWLGTQGIRNMAKDEAIYPEFTPNLTMAFERELEHLAVELMLGEDATFEQFFARETSYLNQRLGYQYGMESVLGPQLRLVTVNSERQGGLLGTGAWLSAHSTENKSSPFRRGTAIRERVLCHELPEPPAIAGVTPEPDEETSNQQRMKAHSSNAQCAGCHVYIDGLGLPLERFDADGIYRRKENGHLISTYGVVHDMDYMGQGTVTLFDGLPGLADVLGTSDQAPNCFVRQLYRSATGEVETPAQERLMRSLRDNFINNGGSTRQLLVDIVGDDSFITRRLEP